MEVAFEILIPKTEEIVNFNFQFESFEWGGETHKQGLEKTNFNRHFTLTKTPIASHLLNLLGQDKLEKEWCCISVTGDGIPLYRQELVDQQMSTIEQDLTDLLQKFLYSIKMWIVVFEVEYSQVERKVRGTWHDIVTQVKQSLVENDNGFIMFSDSKQI